MNENECEDVHTRILKEKQTQIFSIYHLEFSIPIERRNKTNRIVLFSHQTLLLFRSHFEWFFTLWANTQMRQFEVHCRNWICDRQRMNHKITTKKKENILSDTLVRIHTRLWCLVHGIDGCFIFSSLLFCHSVLYIRQQLACSPSIFQNFNWSRRWYLFTIHFILLLITWLISLHLGLLFIFCFKCTSEKKRRKEWI